MDRQEEGVIRAFVVRPKRQRLLGLLERPARRTDVTDLFAHFYDWDSRYAHRVPPQPYEQEVQGILQYLRSKGAPAKCHVMSDDKRDGRDIELEEAIRGTIGCGQETILSCIPGKLAYYEGEN